MPNAQYPIPETWPRCPDASDFFIALFRAFASHNPFIEQMSHCFQDCAGVNILNLIDHWTLPESYSLKDELGYFGLEERKTDEGDVFWEHPAARFPRIRVDSPQSEIRMALAVEDLALFAEANDLPLTGQHGDPGCGYEEIRYPLPHGELAIIVRNGYRGFQPGSVTAGESRMIEKAKEAFRNRDRSGEAEEVAVRAGQIFSAMSEELGKDRAVDEFFSAERNYYMARNRAAAWQYERQQTLGIGWANHDHHTYRCSREGFRSLLNLWEEMGFVSRERFYAGTEAGWGAQILEHPVSKVVLFCDVDIAPDELDIDFSAVDLPPRDILGTIGLWCGLHSDSIGAAGMHHLEAEFEFNKVKALLISQGFEVMQPFTDMPMLKQAFTVAENWQVQQARVTSLLKRKLITEEQANRFLIQGAPGSHLEILQRWEGFKGFNKTGVSQIILATDARSTG